MKVFKVTLLYAARSHYSCKENVGVNVPVIFLLSSMAASCFGCRSHVDFTGTVFRQQSTLMYFSFQKQGCQLLCQPVTHLSHLLGPHSVLNQPLHICSHGEARSLENLFGKMQQLLSGREKPGYLKNISNQNASLLLSCADMTPCTEDRASRLSIAGYAASASSITGTKIN